MVTSRDYGVASLLSVNSDHKTVKGLKRGYLTGIMYLAPHTLAGGRTMCPWAGLCARDCLYTSGKGACGTTVHARVARTRFYLERPHDFETQLAFEVGSLVRRAARAGLVPCVRLNGTSDQTQLALRLVEQFPRVQFYDYTKHPRAWLAERPNYRLTFSADGRANLWNQLQALEHGVNVAVVFAGRIPARYLGHDVVVGDHDDLRFLDPRPRVIGLTPKGRARKSRSGFVVRVP